MITEAEKRSNQNKPYHKRSCSDRNDKDSRRISGSNVRKHSRSRSRSRNREKYNTSDYSSQRRGELKRTFQIPKDNNDYSQQTMSATSRMKNWKIDKSDGKKRHVVELPRSEPRKVDLGNINSTNEIDKARGIGECILTEAEMNKLGARIIKAELMGDDVRFLLHQILLLNCIKYCY